MARPRSLAIGIHQTAIYAGAVLSGLCRLCRRFAATGLADGFFICGVAGIVYVVPLVGRPAQKPPPAPDTPKQHVGPGSSTARTGHESRLSTDGALFGGLASRLGDSRLDACNLKEQFGLGQGKAGVSTVLYVQLASLVGAAWGGWQADRWMGRTPRGRIFVSAIGMMLFLPALFGVGNAGTLSVAIVFLIVLELAGAFSIATTCPFCARWCVPNCVRQAMAS